MHIFRLIVACLLLIAFAAPPATGQQVQGNALEVEMKLFYKDPRPERLIGFIERYQGQPGGTEWLAYPPLAGFLAVVFRAKPNEIERLLPSRLDTKSAATFAAALVLSDNQPLLAKLKGKLDSAGSDEKLRTEFAGLPARLEDIRIRTSTHLDILWGASFASGDGRYARMIVDFFARTANRSEPIAMDVARTAIAMMGGPKDIFGELKPRYGNDLTVEIIIAGTALWGIQANAREHAFIDQVVTKYISEQAGTHAAQALAATRPRPKKP